jgi:hypothetical protein
VLLPLYETIGRPWPCSSFQSRAWLVSYSFVDVLVLRRRALLILNHIELTFDVRLIASCTVPVCDLQFRSCVMLLRSHAFIVMLCVSNVHSVLFLYSRGSSLTDTCFLLFLLSSVSQRDFPSLSPFLSGFFHPVFPPFLSFFLLFCSLFRFRLLEALSRTGRREARTRTLLVCYLSRTRMGWICSPTPTHSALRVG